MALPNCRSTGGGNYGRFAPRGDDICPHRPIGRAVRLLLAALLAVFALDLIGTGVTDHDRTEFLRFPGFWLLTVATIDTVIRFLPLPRRRRWLAPAGLAAAATTPGE